MLAEEQTGITPDAAWRHGVSKVLLSPQIQRFASAKTAYDISEKSSEFQTCALPEKRTLGYAEFGSPHGNPVFYFHGSPASRLETRIWHDCATKTNTRLIGVDRPGIGLSSLPSSPYNLLNWPTDILHLADHLNLAKFHVIGASGGGPYAVACAHSLPQDRLLRAGVMAGMGPVEYGYAGTSWQRYIAFNTNRYLPRSWLHWLVDKNFAVHAQNPDTKVFERKVIDKFINTALPAADAALFKDPKTRQDLIDDWRQAFRQGAGGYVQDAKILFSPWGFDLKDVKGEVRLWYGSGDVFTPVGMGRYLAERMPRARLREVEGATHFTIADGEQGVRILEELVEGT
ncbi:hypothetical protein LTR37_009650 [Vermiconidia calcicola]|uniref:Uncharacterized protein n=1 Tax=Vermiconidia calcicola TaxID=1690605 RepID=A0ACC3N8Z0_9PEZI|nr:hypothetical protein LTR37_009650 [Vermiconidia calcicola]